MSTVYAIANQKGGVGKTTTAVNLAACVAEAGYESLLVDIDPQCNATLGLGLTKQSPATVYDVLAGSVPLDEIIVRAGIDHLSVAGMLLTMHDGRTRLAQDVERDVREHFPELVFDTVIPRNVRIGEAPSFGKPVIHHDPHCAGADAYFELAKEVAARG